ncbi:MAG: glycosyltransferase family 2 protein, partial [Deltaproteobacteria bacterium]
RWEGRPLDPRVRVDGPVRKLKNPSLHYSFRDLSDHVERMNRYSGLFAQGLMEEGRPFRLWKLVLHPPFRFLRNYFLKRGFMDGMPGLIAAVSSAYYVFLKYAKLWELERKTREK